MQELMFAYLTSPRLESYLALRTALLAHEEYNPYSSTLDRVVPWLAQENYHQAEQWLQSILYPDYFLNPGAHFLLSGIYEALGKPEQSKIELTLGAHCLQGIEMTGDGTRDAPFLVTRICDAYDLLHARQLHLVSQQLHEAPGKRWDVIQTREGQEYWFDMTDVYAILDRTLSQLEEEEAFHFQF